MSLTTPLSAGRRGKCVHESSRAHYSTELSDHCDSGQNKTHIFSKSDQKSFLSTISVLPLCNQSAQPFPTLATRAEAWQVIPVVSTWVMATHKTRLYTPIRSKTTTIPLCARHHSAQRERSSPQFAGKRSLRNRSSSPERVRLLQPLFLHPQKRWRTATYSRSQTPELRPDEKAVQDDIFETDPPANMPDSCSWI